MEQKEIVAEEKIVSKSTGIGILIADERQVYMARLLEEKGYTVVTWDLREGPMPRGTEKLWCAGGLILPVPVSRITDQERLEQCLIAHRYDIQLCIGGAFSKSLRALLDEYGIPWLDVLEESGVAMKNAIATAEGCIAELSQLMPVNIEDANIIVMGFGNCGKPIAEKLYCMGAHVSIVARSERALSMAHYFGFLDYPMDAVIPFDEADAVINTIPALVITKKEIDALKKDAVVLDIASAPGGCDGAYCKEKGVPYKLALGLPGIYCPKTSAQILLEAMPFDYHPHCEKWKS